MKVLQLVLIACLLAILSGGIFAADMKIGYVNKQALLLKAPQALDVRNKLKKELDKVQKLLSTSEKELLSKEQKLKKDKALMSKADVKKLISKINSLRSNLKRDFTSYNEDLRLLEKDMLVAMDKIVLKVISDVAKKKKYDLVVSDGVLYVNKRINLTADILKELNKQYKSKK